MEDSWKQYQHAIQEQEVQASELAIRIRCRQEQIEELRLEAAAYAQSSLQMKQETNETIAEVLQVQDELDVTNAIILVRPSSQ